MHHTLPESRSFSQRQMEFVAVVPGSLFFAFPHFLILLQHSPEGTHLETLNVLPGTHSRMCPSALAGVGEHPGSLDEVTKSGLLPLAFTLHVSLVMPGQLRSNCVNLLGVFVS